MLQMLLHLATPFEVTCYEHEQGKEKRFENGGDVDCADWFLVEFREYAIPCSLDERS